MAIPKGFQIDRRVGIAMDALSPRQKAALGPVLQDRANFVAHARRPGVTKKLSAEKPVYSMKAGPGMRVIFAEHDDRIIVLDLMRKATMDLLKLKEKGKAAPAKKTPAG